MPSFSALEAKKRELIRKATRGLVAIADLDADPITAVSTYTAGPPAVIAFAALPTGYKDLGWLTQDGAQFAREVSQATISSWGSITPTRTDVTGDSTTMTVVPQETNLRTIALATGAAQDGILPAVNTGEVSISKPEITTPRSYRVLAAALDASPTGKEIMLARFMPAAKVTGFAAQNFGGGDEAISWGVTFSAETDSALGYSERWIFGGPGWNELLEDMGWTP